MYSRRRFVRTSGFRRRRKKNWLWARTHLNFGTINGASVFPTDLLAQWRAQQGIIINLPDLHVWRVIIRISLRVDFTTTSLLSQKGVGISIFCDDITDSQLVFGDLVQPYTESFMMWDFAYLTEQFYNGVNSALPASDLTTNVLYRFYDIRSHRNFENIVDTLLCVLSPGGCNITDGSITSSVLLKVGK